VSRLLAEEAANDQVDVGGQFPVGAVSTVDGSASAAQTRENSAMDCAPETSVKVRPTPAMVWESLAGDANFV